MQELARPTRRRFLASSGALVVAFAWRPPRAFAADAPELPGSLKAQPLLDDGEIRADAARSVAYAELVAGPMLHVPAQAQDAVREAATRTVVGKSMRRVDIPAKLSGGTAYVQDLRFDGMVHGRVLRPPSPA